MTPETMLGYVAREGAAAQSTAALGYCMSGQYVVAVMGAYPEAFLCGASYYGVRIVTDEEDSPHLKADQIKGELYLAFAERDHWVPDDTLERIRHLFTGDGRVHRVEVYPGTEHGFAFWKRPVYHPGRGRAALGENAPLVPPEPHAARRLGPSRLILQRETGPIPNGSWLGNPDSNQDCSVQSREFYR